MTPYFENLSKGDTFDLGSIPMAKEERVTFAERIGPPLFQLNKEAIAESVFGRLDANGLFTLCQAVRLFVAEFFSPEAGLSNIGGLGIDDVDWHEAVQSGEELSLIAKMVEGTLGKSI